MDLQSVMPELYAVRPSEFTSARDEYVARARKAGDRDLAAAIAALRRPTVAAWTAGLPARLRPEAARELLALGEALRSAHRTLDAEQLRKLSHDQHVVIGRLARTARSLAAEVGQAVSDPVLNEVERIFHGVLADPDVAARWAAGRLVKAPDPASGFAGLEAQPGAAPPQREAAAARPGGPATERTPAPDAGAGAGASAARARRERAEAVRAELAEARAEEDRLNAGQATARELADSTAAALAQAEEEVRIAAEHLEEARAASAAAAAGSREAARAAAKARRRAETAARKAGKLTAPEG